jgi:hypothetical protein
MSGMSGPNDLFAADVDRDGVHELYAPTDAGHLVQGLSRPDGSWNAWDLGEVPEDQDAGDVVLGDVDNDGGLEAYVSAFRFDTCCPSHNVYKFTPAGSPPPPRFDATFTKVTGNEWWIQANVAATGGTLSKVEVRLNGGEWKPLPKQSWGGWAASYHAPQGTIVQMRASSTTGATDLSDCYRWIPTNGQDAAKVACPGTPPPPPPPPPPGAVTFSSVGGNEWWVEAVVTSDRTVSGVQVHVNCGAGTAMQFHRDWGKWAVSVHVPSGAKVSFTAFVDGTASKSGGYIWPGATPTSGC